MPHKVFRCLTLLLRALSGSFRNNSFTLPHNFLRLLPQHEYGASLDTIGGGSSAPGWGPFEVSNWPVWNSLGPCRGSLPKHRPGRLRIFRARVFTTGIGESRADLAEAIWGSADPVPRHQVSLCLQ